MSNDQSTTHLLEKISKKRECLMTIASRSGMQSEDTIKISQDLDKLIFEYQNLVYKKKNHRLTSGGF